MDKASASPAPVSSGKAKQSAGNTRWQKLLLAVAVGYLAVVVILCAWMIWDGDRGEFGTVLLYGPRFLIGVPLPFLTVLAAVFRPRLLWLVAIAAVVLVRPVMGLQVHVPPSVTQPRTLRVLSANVHQNDFRTDALLELIEREQPDVVALQEVNSITRFFWPADWQVIVRDEFILASRFPVEELEHVRRSTLSGEIVAMRFGVRTPDAEIQVFNVHLQTPRAGLEAVLSSGSMFSAKARQQMDDSLASRALESGIASTWLAKFPGPKIVMGDFNMPVESRIYRRDWSFLLDAFGASGCGFGFTKFSEAGPLQYGTRIDHVLFNDAWRCLRCWVGDDIGSDHWPLLAELETKP